MDFTPLGAGELLGIAQGELVNCGVPADELFSQSWVRELVERVNETIERAMTLLAEGNDTDLSSLALKLFSSEFSASLRHREYKVVAATPTSA